MSYMKMKVADILETLKHCRNDYEYVSRKMHISVGDIKDLVDEQAVKDNPYIKGEKKLKCA